MKKKWWHDKIAYQIYPKSFYDSNGDGIGDVRGIIEKLDYLKELGVDILWLSPIYMSPMVDEGYDISDYYSIDPRFGTMEDVDELIREAGKREMYILMDLVVNHCSDDHVWFRRACENPEGPYGKYFYIRSKKPDGSMPTNWRAFFGGSAWEELPGHPDKCYLHYFHKRQPDLNWENPELLKEIYKNMEWWLEKGLAGFRVDAISYIQKPEVFRDYPADREDGLASAACTVADAPGLEDKLRDIKEKIFDKYDAFTVGEVCHVEEERLPSFIGEKGCFCSVFDFEEDTFGFSPKGLYDRTPCLPEDYKHCVFRAQAGPGSVGFLSNIIENHDEARGVSRYIPEDELSDTSKKGLAAGYFLLRGIPFIYQGQEIGMENHRFTSPDEIKDVNGLDQYNAAILAGCSREKALDSLSKYSRDNARTPMQWSDEKHAGFTAGTPWMYVNEKYPVINVERNLKDPDSVLNFYKQLIRLRKEPAYKNTFVYGELVPYLPETPNLMAYLRKGECTILIAVNMQMEKRKMVLPENSGEWKLLLSNTGDVCIENNEVLLTAWQAAVLLKTSQTEF